jgi:hypothetical protein
MPNPQLGGLHFVRLPVHDEAVVLEEEAFSYIFVS